MGVMKRVLTGARAGRLFEVEYFFDRKAVTSAVDSATRRVLSKFGAYVRQTAKRSIKRPRRKTLAEMSPIEVARYRASGRKPAAPSAPGTPPRNQYGLLRQFMLFWYSPRERSVTIGPAKLPGKHGDVPGVLEHGGTTVNRRGKVVYIAARPYMGPALEKELPKLEPMWRNSVKGGA